MTSARRPLDLAMTEAQWQEQVLQLATLLDWGWYHTHDSRRSPAGFPDLVLVRDRVVFAELKAEQGRLTRGQAEWQEQLHLAGAECYVWRPSDFDTVEKCLRVRLT